MQRLKILIDHSSTWLVLCALMVSELCAAPKSDPSTATPSPAPARKILTRVFFQDDEARALKWADVVAGEPPQLEPARPVAGFPTLDTKRQTLVQMKAARGLLLVGVRDEEDGAFQSGWVLIDAGVEEEEHGDHSHWSYPRTPSVRATLLDTEQGNPAHLYTYDDVFYLANDKLSGFTQLDPSTITRLDNESTIRKRARFHSGGGGHITLAVAGGKVAYSTWIDREGPQKGRVDVTYLKASGTPQSAGSLSLPSGGLHGATACEGKVFFAPAEGVYWINARPEMPFDPQQVQVHHLSLGKEGDKPRRTGSFATCGRTVGFTTGTGQGAAACFLDAGRNALQLVEVPLAMEAEARPGGLTIVKPRQGSPVAFVFHARGDESAKPDRLSLLELKTSAQGALESASVVANLIIGHSRPDGHSGHHEIAVDGDRRQAIFTNPGDGTLVLLSLKTHQPVGEFKVGGVPTKILCVGGRGKSD